MTKLFVSGSKMFLQKSEEPKEVSEPVPEAEQKGDSLSTSEQKCFKEKELSLG